MDLPSLRAVGAPVVAGIGNGRSIGGHPSVTELGWWDSADVGGVTVTFVPSQHWSRRALEAPNRALWGGFVVESAGVRVYHSGDTAYFEGFQEIGRRFPRIRRRPAADRRLRPSLVHVQATHEPGGGATRPR